MVVVGSSGLLGSDVTALFRTLNWDVIAPARALLDITDDRSVTSFFLNCSPDWIVNCAAYTAVDKAETDKDRAFLVNAFGAYWLGRVHQWTGARIVHLSTDFVFDGAKSTPYMETDETNPLSVYGASKLKGEKSLFDAAPNSIVVRSAWLFGPNGNCFPKSILKSANSGKALRVVNDQFGSPTYTKDLAQALANILAAAPEPGNYHCVNSGVATWFDLAKEVVPEPVSVEPISSAEWPTAAKRPPYSVLSTQKYESLGFQPLPDWRNAVKRFLTELA